MKALRKCPGMKSIFCTTWHAHTQKCDEGSAAAGALPLACSEGRQNQVQLKLSRREATAWKDRQETQHLYSYVGQRQITCSVCTSGTYTQKEIRKA